MSSKDQPARDDRITAAAIAALAMAVVTVDHEAIGHGSACLALGGRITLLTSVYFHCSVPSAWVAAAGPAGNLAGGALVWLALKRLSPRSPAVRLLLVLILALSFFWEGGYLFYSMARGDGGWAIAARAAFGEPAWAWRAGGFGLGLCLYLTGARAAAAGLQPFAGADGARVRRILRTCWVSAGLAACAAALAYAPDRWGAVQQAALEIAAASIPLLTLPARLGAAAGDPARELGRSRAWLFGACTVFLAFAASLGRGIVSG